MRIVCKHSHLNGLEFMLIRAPSLWKEIEDAILEIQFEFSKTLVMAGPRKITEAAYPMTELLSAFEGVFAGNSWISQNRPSVELVDELSVRTYTPSFLKDRVAISIHLTDSWEVSPEIHARHLALFNKDLIDVGIEIVPTKTLHDEMSSGVPYYEGELYNLIREGRGVPGVPLVLVGIEP